MASEWRRIAVMALRRVTLAVVLPFGATLAFAPLLFLGTTDVPDVTPAHGVSSATPDVLGNLATSIAFRAGLIRRATAAEIETLREIESPDGVPLPGGYWIATGGALSCAGSRTARAILATESYLRPSWRRHFEIELARTTYTLTGTYPDWSYGMAQIRPSTARRILGDGAARLTRVFGLTPDVTLSDAELFALLADPCQNAELTGLAIKVYGSDGDRPAAHALRHAGGKPLPTMPGLFDYASLVDHMDWNVLGLAEERYNILAGFDPQDTPQERWPTGRYLLRYSEADWPDSSPAFCLRYEPGGESLRVIFPYASRELAGVPEAAVIPAAGGIIALTDETGAVPWHLTLATAGTVPEAGAPTGVRELGEWLDLAAVFTRLVGVAQAEADLVALDSLPPLETVHQNARCDAVLIVAPPGYHSYDDATVMVMPAGR